MNARQIEHDWFSRPVPSNVRLHETAWLYSSYAFVHCHSKRTDAIRVGRDSGLYHGTFFDTGPDAEIEIGNYCSLVGVIFTTNGHVAIGDYSFLAHEVVIADSPWALPRPGTCNSAELIPAATRRNRIEIGQNVWIGARVVIAGQVRIGDGAVVGAGAVVTHDIPPYKLCVGNPMRIARTLALGEGLPNRS